MDRFVTLLLVGLLALTPVVQAAHVCCLQSDAVSAIETAEALHQASLNTPCHGSAMQAQVAAESSDIESSSPHQCVHNGSCCLAMVAAIGPQTAQPQAPRLKPVWLAIELHPSPAIIQRLDRPPSFI